MVDLSRRSLVAYAPCAAVMSIGALASRGIASVPPPETTPSDCARIASELADRVTAARSAADVAGDERDRVLTAINAAPVPVPSALYWRPEDDYLGIMPLGNPGPNNGLIYKAETVRRLMGRQRMRDIVQPHPDLPGDQIIRCVPDAPAQARAEEIIHAWNAYRDAKHEQKAALGWDEADRAYDAALDQLEVAACALVDLLSPNIEAIRRKAETLAVIADWDLLAAEAKEASLGFDLRMAVSIARDIAGFFGLLETSTDVADATQIA